MDFLNRAEICENFLLRIYDDGIFCFRYFRFYFLPFWPTPKQIIFSCFPNGFLPRRISPEETFAPKRPLGQEWMSKKCLTLLGKEYMWSGKKLTYQNSTTWAICLQKMWLYRQDTAIPQRLLLLLNLLICSTKSDMCHYSSQGISLRKKPHKVILPTGCLSIFLDTYGLLCSREKQPEASVGLCLRVSD